MNATTLMASVDGVALQRPEEDLSPAELRQRACTRLLLQEAQRHGLTQADDDPVITEAQAQAIETLLERELAIADPDDETCRRHHAAHRARFGTGERVRARHILFAVTPGVDISALGAFAEQLLVGLRCASDRDESFAQVARKHSNCPSGANGGELGWIGASDCAPEVAREIFDRPAADAAAATGILPRLVRSRFGLHIVDVIEREPGIELPWEEVRAAVVADLRRQSWITALRRYLGDLAARATIEGVEIDGVGQPESA